MSNSHGTSRPARRTLSFLATGVIVAIALGVFLTRQPEPVPDAPPGSFSFAVLGDAPYYIWEEIQFRRVLRDSGFACARIDGARRMYMIEPLPMREVDVWLHQFRALWEQKLEALATEVARGKRNRRAAREGGA